VGPLSGYRVVEIAEGVAGPAAAMQLGDAGADVVKIEPVHGDRARAWAPGVDGAGNGDASSDDSVTVRALNRSKRSLALEWSTTGAVEIAAALLQWADVAIVDGNDLPHPALAGVLREANPDLVWLALSGFGPSGPWAGRAGGELPAQLASEATASLGAIGEPPVRVGTDVGGMYAAIYGVQAICAALLARDEHGGQRIDVSLFGSLLAMRSTLWVALSNPDEWWGFHLDSYTKPPDHGYRCRDDSIYFSLARMSPDAMDALLHDLGMEWAKADPLFPTLVRDTAGGTGRHAHEVHHLWERGFANHDADEVRAIIERHGGIAFPMNDYARLVEHPHVQHAGVVITLDGFQTVAPPWDFDGTPVELTRGAPALGEHSRAVLAEAGYDAASLVAFVRDGLVVEG
jgi:crotonobetainyl-CoA:carnitine CoA-transferase CaiB-like acyl-CoA transferase